MQKVEAEKRWKETLWCDASKACTNMRMDVVWWAACVGTSIGDILFDDGL
jgi:hypothetical protein